MSVSIKSGRVSRSLIAAMGVLVVAAGQARGGELIINGGFESGLAGWTVADAPRERRHVLRPERDRQPGQRRPGPRPARRTERRDDRRPGARLARALPGFRGPDQRGRGSPAQLRPVPRQPGRRLLHAEPGLARLRHRRLQPAGPRRPAAWAGRTLQRRPGRRAPEHLPDQSGRPGGLGIHDHRGRPHGGPRGARRPDPAAAVRRDRQRVHLPDGRRQREPERRARAELPHPGRLGDARRLDCPFTARRRHSR